MIEKHDSFDGMICLLFQKMLVVGGIMSNLNFDN